MGQAPKTEAPGTGGESLVRARLEFMGFGVVENTKHDLGIDHFVMVRDARRFDRLILMMVQSKTQSATGESYFHSPEHDQAGNIIGWWYEESDAKHFDDWVQHHSPHLLVLTNEADENSFWVHVTREAVVSTGKGHKIMVPATNLLKGAKEQLLAVAETGQVLPTFQGTSFHASAQVAAPGRVLRHALLTPRLIAPHPNAVGGRALEPEEVIALAAAGRLDEFRHLAEATVSQIGDAGPAAKDWRWRFFAAFTQYVRDHDPEPLRALAHATLTAVSKADKQPLERCAAVAVAAAAAQSENGGWQAAADILALIGDNLSPVDHAWVTLWKGIVAAERREFEPARDFAVEAMTTVLLDREDPTAAAIGASASAFLFYAAALTGEKTSPAGEKQPAIDLSRFLTLNDTAASWWRAQAINAVVREQDDLDFRRWAGRAEPNDLLVSSLIRLRAVWVSALLAGDRGAAGAAAELWATRIVRAYTSGPWSALNEREQAEVVQALDALRNASRDATLDLVARRLWRDGVTEPLKAALEHARGDGWSPSGARPYLSLLTAAGDLLDMADADSTVLELLKIISGPDEFRSEYRVSFDPRYFGMQALATVIPAASTDQQALALQEILGLVGKQNENVADVLISLVYDVVRGVFDEPLLQVQDAVMAAADPEASWQFLHVLRAAGSSEAADKLAAAIGAGNPDALATLQDLDLLPPDGLRKVIETDGKSCQDITLEATTTGPAFGGGEQVHAARLVAANLRAPQDAQWQPLHSLLAEPRATSASKSLALEILLADWALVPVEEQEQLRTVFRDSQAFTAVPGLNRSEPYEALTVSVGHRLGEVSDTELRRRSLSWLSGDSVQRLAAARLITRAGASLPVELREVLCADPDAAIRAAALIGLLDLPDEQDRIPEVLEPGLTDGGCYVAHRVAERLASPTFQRSAASDEIAVKLSMHPSGRVRRLALRAMVKS